MKRWEGDDGGGELAPSPGGGEVRKRSITASDLEKEDGGEAALTCSRGGGGGVDRQHVCDEEED